MAQIFNETISHNQFAFAQNGFAGDCIMIAACAVAVFEYVITIPHEISCIWAWGLSPFSIFLLLTRYGTLAFGVVALANVFVTSEAACTFVVRTYEGLVVYLTAICCAGSAIRVYALSRRLWLAVAIVVLGGFSIAVKMTFVIWSTPLATPVPTTRCTSWSRWPSAAQSYCKTPQGHLRPPCVLTIVDRLLTTLAEAAVLIVTLRSTLSSARNARRVNMKVYFVSAMLRNGTMCFMVASVLNIAQMALYGAFYEFYLVALISVINPIMLSRLFLDLRRIVTAGNPTSVSNLSLAFEQSVQDIHPSEDADVVYLGIRDGRTDDRRSMEEIVRDVEPTRTELHV